MKNHKVRPMSASVVALLLLANAILFVFIGWKIADEMSRRLEPVQKEMR